MKLKVLMVSVLAFLIVSVSSASAYYYMTINQAKRETVAYAREGCEELAECIGYGVGRCARRSASGVSCTAARFYPGTYEGEEIQCNTRLHWGVSRSGVIVLKNAGEPYCFSV